MEKQFPKNVRQIGNVCDSPKIYVEDYVDTFLNQLCDKMEEEPQGAFLIGEKGQVEDQDCVYISGAVRISEIVKNESKLNIPEAAVEAGMKDCKEYFGNQSLIGWSLIDPSRVPGTDENLEAIHKKYFAEENTIFIMKDPKDRDEKFYAYKYEELMEINGHYIYYEKNPEMQNYMISSRKENKITPSESITDRAAKDFRSIVKAKLEKADQKQNNRFLYAASTFLLIVILIIGVTMVNNYDKIKAVQTSIDQITKTVEKAENEKEAQAAEGKVTTQVEETTEEETGKTDTAGTTQTPDTDSNGEYYVVQRGDTLATISQKLYGDTSHIDAIARMNGLTNGDFIYIGQKLLLP